MTTLNVLNEYIASQGSGAAGRDLAASTLVQLISSSPLLTQGCCCPGAGSPLPGFQDTLSRTPKGLQECTTVRQWWSKSCTRAAWGLLKSSPSCRYPSWSCPMNRTQTQVNLWQDKARRRAAWAQVRTEHKKTGERLWAAPGISVLWHFPNQSSVNHQEAKGVTGTISSSSRVPDSLCRAGRNHKEKSFHRKTLACIFYRGIHIQSLCLEAQNINSALLLCEINSKFSYPAWNKHCAPCVLSSVSMTTYLWGKHFNQLVQKPEFCYFIMKSFAAVIHTGL